MENRAATGEPAPPPSAMSPPADHGTSTTEPSSELHVLIVEDSELDAKLLAREITKKGYAIRWQRVDSASAMRDALAALPWDVILCDYSLPGFGGIEALHICQGLDLDIPFILVSGTMGEDLAVEAMRAGAHDYLMKDNLARLLPAIDRELRDTQVRRQRREGQAHLRRLATAIDQADEVIVITDADGTIEYANPAFERTSGYTCEEAIGQNPRLLKSGRHDEAFYQDLWRTIAEGGTWRGRFTNRQKDGELYQEDAVISPVRGSDGSIVNYVAVKRDITREVMLEAQLRQSQKLESIGTLASGIAHEINNPIMGIMNYAELIKDHGGDTAKNTELAGEIIHETQRVAVIVRNLLRFARAEQSATHRETDVAEMLEATASLIRTIMRHNHIDLTIDIPRSLTAIRCNMQQIQQVIMNILTNACDALNEKYPAYHDDKRIAITAEEIASACSGDVSGPSAGPLVRITIEDRGPGISAAVRERMFAPFYPPTPRERGTGLGLSISHGIIRDHNGRLSVESAPGQWTRFHIDLPAT